jgi:hypothetical protein
MTIVTTPSTGSMFVSTATTERRRTPLRIVAAAGVVVLVAVAVAVAGIAMAVVNYQRASTWEDRAVEWEARAVASDERAAQLDRDLAEARNNLAIMTIGLDTANADRLELQGRVDELAGEKASAQDQQRVAEAERDTAYYFAGLAGDAAENGALCLNDVFVALDAINSYSYGFYVDSLISQAVYSCGQFDDSYNTFARAVGY